MPEFLVNAIITPDGTRLESVHRHDYQEHIDSISGELYFTDGGLEYTRRSINIAPATDVSVTTKDAHEVIRQAFKWGTHGKDGNQPLRRIPVADLEVDHIKAILATQTQLKADIRRIFVNELAFRAGLGRLSYPDIV